MGKDTVAKFLQESRNFVAVAFADKIKEEYGVSIEDFEAAKISGEITKMRAELWKFSAEKKKEDPLYFIRKVMEDVVNSDKSVVITDIRTPDELRSFYEYGESDSIRRVYYIVDQANQEGSISDEGFIKESKLHRRDIIPFLDTPNMEHIINNSRMGVYKFSRTLEKFFFTEDIMDLSGPSDKPDPEDYIMWRRTYTHYIEQFNVMER